MEKHATSLSLLLQLGERFFEVWNLQIIIAVAAVVFIMSNKGLTVRHWTGVEMNVVLP